MFVELGSLLVGAFYSHSGTKHAKIAKVGSDDEPFLVGCTLGGTMNAAVVEEHLMDEGNKPVFYCKTGATQQGAKGHGKLLFHD